MIETTEILPGVNLRCFRDTRFKQGRLIFQFVRAMEEKEAAFNALLPDVMLRATEVHPDMRAISQHLDSHPVPVLGRCSGWLPLFPQWCRNGLGGSGQCPRAVQQVASASGGCSHPQGPPRTL